MQSISVFLDITKFADFQWKNADVSRTQGVCRESSLGNCTKFHHCRISVTDFREGGIFGSPHPWAFPKMPILNRVKFKDSILIYLCSDLIHKFQGINCNITYISILLNITINLPLIIRSFCLVSVLPLIVLPL